MIRNFICTIINVAYKLWEKEHEGKVYWDVLYNLLNVLYSEKN